MDNGQWSCWQHGNGRARCVLFRDGIQLLLGIFALGAPRRSLLDECQSGHLERGIVIAMVSALTMCLSTSRLLDSKLLTRLQMTRNTVWWVSWSCPRWSYRFSSACFITCRGIRFCEFFDHEHCRFVNVVCNNHLRHPGVYRERLWFDHRCSNFKCPKTKSKVQKTSWRVRLFRNSVLHFVDLLSIELCDRFYHKKLWAR